MLWYTVTKKTHFHMEKYFKISIWVGKNTISPAAAGARISPIRCWPSVAGWGMSSPEITLRLELRE